ncbi:uncharacterized protein EHS24_007286 [Apiotrichum porosum]|uniref:Aminotransferase class I/classII large domain-containing protein n=1 Tax=Apiotrichum porosum TaxID=105984 RepID=A0A427XXJ5_9TREE|nr:uncharacterized protein EHS24_007286 [Apiotrichum porosum]RSH83598.1 hypothetical protein EHS24_007286 [Apiotrichum porosum]
MAPVPVQVADSAVSSPFPQSPKTTGPPVDQTNFLSDRARTTEIDGIRGLLPLETPDVVSFLAGKPNPATFPFGSITLNLKPSISGRPAESITLDGADLDHALQYGPSAGLTSLRNWLTALQERVHKRTPGNWTVSLGSGSQDLMTKCFSAVLNPGDPILVETPVYSGVLPALRLLNADMIEVDVDDQGLSATRLAEILDSWPADKKKPRVIYSTPVGCNPSGCSASPQRKLDVLQVMQKHNLLMMEDDPYCELDDGNHS